MVEIHDLDGDNKGPSQTNWSDNNGPAMQQDNAGTGSTWGLWKDNAGNSSMGESSKDTKFDKVQAHSQEVEMRAASTSEATGPAQASESGDVKTRNIAERSSPSSCRATRQDPLTQQDPWKRGTQGIAVPSASSSARAPARREFQRPKFGQKPAGAAGRDTGRWAWQVSPAERPPARDAEQKEKRLKQLHGTQALHAVHGILSRKSEEELLEDDSSLFDEERLAGAGEDFDVVYKGVLCKITGSNTENLPRMTSFEDMFNLFKDQIPSSLEDNIRRCRYKTPTPVQKYVLPCALSGRDVMCCAETGSGKTVSYLIPVLASMIRCHKEGVGRLEVPYKGVVKPDCLILAPTRELTLQIYDDAARFCHRTEFRVVRIYGQEEVKIQLDDVSKGADVVIATPGRLWDYVETEVIDLKKVNCLVLDDADRLLESRLGWSIKPIITEFGMPDKENRQTMMFSATFPDHIQKTAMDYLYEHVWVGVGAIGGAVSTVTQALVEVKQSEKLEKLLEIIDEFFEKRVARKNKEERLMIFTNSIKQAKALDEHLFDSNHVDSSAIHSEIPQHAREANLKKFRRGDIDVLVCTDLASRGLDIQGVSTVVNFDMARDIGTYIQRIGRTGRIGHRGHSITFITTDNAGYWRDDQTVLRDLLQVMTEAHADIPEWFARKFKQEDNENGAAAWSKWQGSKWKSGERDVWQND